MWDHMEQRRKVILYLSSEEIEAENLFLEALQRCVSYSEAILRARDIESRSEIAGRRLRWLLTLHRRGAGDFRKFPLNIAV